MITSRANTSEELKEKIATHNQSIGNLTHVQQQQQQNPCLLNTSNEDFSKYYRQELVNSVRSSLGGTNEVQTIYFIYLFWIHKFNPNNDRNRKTIDQL